MSVNPGGPWRTLAGRWSYDTHDVLSRGSNAITYGGEDLETGEEVVVKTFRDSEGRRDRERFQREARLHRDLKHEAILELLGSGTEGGVDYIVTRRLRPGSLAKVLEKRVTLSPPETRSIGTRIARGLAYMHGRGEVHGDISPGNILLDHAEDAYLADFGFSKQVHPMMAASSGDAFGTPGFSAPRELGTPRTREDDVFSLGAVLWCCLTGRPPHSSARERRRELPDRRLRRPLERALRWEDERVPSAAEFGEALENGWRRIDHDWRNAPSRPRRSPRRAVVAAALALLLVAVLVGQVFRPKPAGAAQTSLGRQGLTLHLEGEWRRKEPPPVPALRLRLPIAAGKGRTTVLAGRASPAGPGLIPRTALKTLPRQARQGDPLAVGDRVALSYGPASQFGGAVQILAIPLERSVLVIRCGGPAATLRRICAQAAADVELSRGTPQPLAPDPRVARRIRAAVAEMSEGRRRHRARLALADSKAELTRSADRLAGIQRSFAARLAALPTTAQDLAAIGGAVERAQAVAAGYSALIDAATPTAWAAARAEVEDRERLLESSIERLGDLPVYRRGG